MSIRIYDQEEMQEILDRLLWLVLGEPVRLHVPVSADWRKRDEESTSTPEDEVERLAWALECAWIAQYAASVRTYYVRREDPRILDPFRIEPLEVRPSRAQPLDELHLRRFASRARLKALADHLGDVLENTASLGGTDFCPAAARDLLVHLRLQLYSRALAEP